MAILAYFIGSYFMHLYMYKNSTNHNRMLEGPQISLYPFKRLFVCLKVGHIFTHYMYGMEVKEGEREEDNRVATYSLTRVRQ